MTFNYSVQQSSDLLRKAGNSGLNTVLNNVIYEEDIGMLERDGWMLNVLVCTFLMRLVYLKIKKKCPRELLLAHSCRTTDVTNVVVSINMMNCILSFGCL